MKNEGKEFRTVNLKGKKVRVILNKDDMYYEGVFKEYFESSNTIVLEDPSKYEYDEEEKEWVCTGIEKLVVIKGNAWSEIEVIKW